MPQGDTGTSKAMSNYIELWLGMKLGVHYKYLSLIQSTIITKVKAITMLINICIRNNFHFCD
jgi:hypothetical protein